MPEMTIDEFHHDLIQGIRAAANANEDFKEAEFAQAISDELSEAGIIEGFEHCPYRAPAGGIRVDGYWSAETALNLFIVDFENREAPESLTQTEINQIFRRAENFFVQSIERNLADSLEDTSAAAGLARQIREQSEEIQQVKFFLLSERVLSDRVQSLDSKQYNGRNLSFDVWDLSRIFRLRSSTGAREALEIDFMEMMGGLPCLPAHLNSDSYRSYLAVIPSRILADLYEKHGSRLLELNVRSFLQIRGNVNKGIRRTILNEPEMFFAYNNGITATARDVEIVEGQHGTLITKLKDLQIVNGGQTTASLYSARRNDKAKLDGIFVQMKLSVVDEEKAGEIVPRISEYANTQNKVNAADFFSNHAFHIRMEEMSRRIWAPAQQGALRETKWFYERARGQYADAQNKRTTSEKNQFLAAYPKAQMFTKTDLAKFDTVWSVTPVSVHAGAQKNFAQYALRIGDDWEKNETQFNDYYFKQAVARGIIFRRTEKLVSAQPWYNGGYRANVVAYSISVMAEICRQLHRHFDFMKVWLRQDITLHTEEALKIIAKHVHEIITNPSGNISNITEWCKREACWGQIKKHTDKIVSQIPRAFFTELLDDEQYTEQVRSAATTRKIQNGIEAQKAVFQVAAEKWSQVLTEGRKLNLFSLKEIEILQIATQIPDKIPTEKQSFVLLEALEKAKQESIYFE